MVRKLLRAVVAFGTTTKSSFNYYVVWMLQMFGLPDKRSSTVHATTNLRALHMVVKISRHMLC
jgi:hypothetical protein